MLTHLSLSASVLTHLSLSAAVLTRLSPSVQARHAELAKMRELLFRHELKAKRVAKIKSRAYRKAPLLLLLLLLLPSLLS